MSRRAITQKQAKITSLLSTLGIQVAGDLGGLTCWTNKNGRKVWMVRETPKEPPTHLQLAQRQRWRVAMQYWNDMSRAQKDDWNTMTLRLSIPMSGTGLWVKISLKNLLNVMPTLERQAKITLVWPTIIP